MTIDTKFPGRPTTFLRRQDTRPTNEASESKHRFVANRLHCQYGCNPQYVSSLCPCTIPWSQSDVTSASDVTDDTPDYDGRCIEVLEDIDLGGNTFLHLAAVHSSIEYVSRQWIHMCCCCRLVFLFSSALSLHVQVFRAEQSH